MRLSYVTGPDLFVYGGSAQIRRLLFKGLLGFIEERLMRKQWGKSQLYNRTALLQPIGSPELFQCHGSRVGLAPKAHRVQQRPQRLSERSNGVYHSRRPVRVHSPFNDSRALQFAELLGKRSLGDPRNPALQFGEPFGALEKLIENSGFPASTDNSCGRFYRAQFWTSSHDRCSCVLYTMYRMDVTYSHVTMAHPSSSILDHDEIRAGFVSR